MRYGRMVVVVAGVLALAGCRDGDRDAGPPATVDVTWMTTMPRGSAPAPTATIGGPGAATTASVPNQQPAPATTAPSPPPPATATGAPLVEPTAPATVGPTPPSSSPADPPVVESAEGCSMAPTPPFVGAIPMRRGDQGDRVLGLQTMLGELGFDLGGSGADGNFGPDTEDAFARYQVGAGQPVTGIVCMEDWYALVTATGYEG